MPTKIMHIQCQCLSMASFARQTNPSSLIAYKKLQEPRYDTRQDIEMIIIDGAAHMNPPKHIKTHSEYCE